jgi:hypothetical protein
VQLAQLGRRGGGHLCPTGSGHGGRGILLPLINSFGVDILGTRRGLGRAAFTGQAQGLSAKGGIIAPTFAGLETDFHDDGKIRPYSVQIYPTTSDRLGSKICIILGSLPFAGRFFCFH